MNIQTVAAQRHLSVLCFLLVTVFGISAAYADPKISIDATYATNPARPQGDTLLTVRISIPSGFILYSPTVVEDGPTPLRMEISSTTDRPAGPWVGTMPQVKYDDAFEKKVEYFTRTATLQRKYTTGEGHQKHVQLTVTGQICDHQSCYNQHLSVSIPLTTAADSQIAPATPSGTVFDANHVIGEVTQNAAETENNPEALGMLAFLLMAILAGFGALLTPCVFPMIPITISFFSKYENISKRRAVFMAGVYAGSIILVYTIPGVLLTMLFGAGSMQTISTHPVFNIFILGLLVFFGLNLIGLFELRLPSALINKSAAKEQHLNRDDQSLRKQILGVFFMAVTFTLVSFSCTVGFVGGWVLPLAARGDALYPLIGMLAFSSAFALPFFLLAVFPRWVQSIQGKAGDWMVAVKVLFGVIELAAAMKFLSNLDLNFGWGLVTRDVALIVWATVFLVGTLIVLNVFSSERTRPTLHRIALAALLLGFALKSGSGIGNTRPMGGWVDGWLPPVPYPTVDGANESQSGNHLTFFQDALETAVASAQNKNVPLFIDFTGFQCANCRQMESNIFPRSRVRDRLSKMERVKLYTDGPKPIHTTQREYQFNRFNTAVLPFYVILNPHNDEVLATFSSLAENEAAFVSFLDRGLTAFHTVSATAPENSQPTSPATDSPDSDSNASLNREGNSIEFQLPELLTHKPFSLSSLRGSWVLINFWSSYCAPCKIELKSAIPDTLTLYPHIKLVTVSVDPIDTQEAAATFIRSTKLKSHIHLLAGEEWADENLPPSFESQFGLPSSFLIRPDGFTAWSHNGAVTERQLEEIFRKTK
ncbi:MAG: redoxin domain-containing protein [Deltaproteobacteria bacterium]|nr:redoxin domain-containing protein [Deltaproteobacteria bacterium]MBN2673307.1 redoxin domain-containing protein [Deltaproteobacteria bacterium]